MTLSIASVIGVLWILPHTTKDIRPYYFVSDSNAILAFITGLSLFMYFKSIHIKQSKFINIVAACSFGVLLFHTTSGMKYVLLEKLLCIPEVLYERVCGMSVCLSVCLSVLRDICHRSGCGYGTTVFVGKTIVQCVK